MQKLKDPLNPNFPPLPKPNSRRIAASVSPAMQESRVTLQNLEKLVEYTRGKDIGDLNYRFGSPDYIIARSIGLISDAEDAKRAEEYALKTKKHRLVSARYNPFKYERVDFQANGGYLPELSNAIYHDPNLKPATIKVAVAIIELQQKQNKLGKTVAFTNSNLQSHLAKNLREGRTKPYCVSTIKTAKNELEEGGYFSFEVVKNAASKMCIGIIATLSPLLFPKHKREAFEKLDNSGGQNTYSNYKKNIYLERIYSAAIRFSRREWANYCQNCLFEKNIKNYTDFN